MNVEGGRPNNRMGCSRAFFQTKDNWKEVGAHSLPRTHHLPTDGDGESGQYSCKATSSAASLTVVNKHSYQSNGIGQGGNGGVAVVI